MSREADLTFSPNDVVVVTGAGSGIGQAISVRASQLGLRVCGWDLNPSALAVTADLVGSSGGHFVSAEADVASDSDVDAGMDLAMTMGDVRYLVNNAGPPSAVPIPFDDGLRIAAGSVRRVTEAWLTRGVPAEAAVVNIASVAGNLVGSSPDWYAASKAAIAGYTRQLASQRTGQIRSNAVAPGMTDTPRLAGFVQSETGQRILGRIPLHRMATPDDIAWAVLFLLSPLASYINGVLLPVDGGWTVAP